MGESSRKCGFFVHDRAALKREYADLEAARGNPEAEAAVLARYGWEKKEDGSYVFTPPNRKARRANEAVDKKPTKSRKCKRKQNRSKKGGRK